MTLLRSGIAPHAPAPFSAPIERGTAAFAPILAEWREVAAQAEPVFAPEVALLAGRLSQENGAVLFGARSTRGLAAALPLVRRGRRLVALRTEHTPRVDLVGDTAALEAMWNAVRDAGAWDVLELRGVPSDSPLATELPRLAHGDGFTVRVHETHKAPWFLVDGIEQRIHRRFRGDMRRLERQLGGVELERITSYDREALLDVLRLEAAAWKGAAGTAISCDRRLTRMYATLARVFARRRQLTLAFLRAQGKRIAASFFLEDATTLYLLKTGYDPEYAHFGPGQLIVRETALDAGKRGLQRYDMMGQATPWKLKWTEEARPHVALTLYAPTARGRAHCFVTEVARPAAGRILRRLGRRADSTPALSPSESIGRR
jgi:CelD/BcsL family acetyltransferase involved in cellulose biosynthesis